jgi:hypothetical protein
MIEIAEGNLRFQFADGWKAIKFDDTPFHKNHMKSQLKAMDIIATDHQQHHWWIEIKDCATFEQENQPRLSPIEPTEVRDTRTWIKAKNWDPIVSAARKKLFIIDEILAKLRDTLFSLSISHRIGHPELSAFSIAENSQSLSIVLLITWDIVDFKRFARLLNQKFNVALRPYGMQGYIANELTQIPGLNYSISRTNLAP